MSKLPFLPRFVMNVVINDGWSFPNHEVSIYIAGEICHSDVIYFTHALVLYIANACVCVFLHRKVMRQLPPLPHC